MDRRLANVGNRVMGQEVPGGIAALGYSKNEALPKLDDAGRAPEQAVSARSKEVSMHLGGHRRIRETQLRLDGEPHRHVCRRHENLTADRASGALECRLEWNVDAASPRRDGVDHEVEVPSESMLAQQGFQIRLAARARLRDVRD